MKTAAICLAIVLYVGGTAAFAEQYGEKTVDGVRYVETRIGDSIVWARPGWTCTATSFNNAYIGHREEHEKVTSALRKEMEQGKQRTLWICVYGKDNYDGRGPSLEVLQQLRSAGMTVIWTAKNLDVVVGTCSKRKIDKVAALDCVSLVAPDKSVVDEMIAKHGRLKL